MGYKMLENLLCCLVADNECKNTQSKIHLNIFVLNRSICQAVDILRLTVLHSSTSLPLCGHPSDV